MRYIYGLLVCVVVVVVVVLLICNVEKLPKYKLTFSNTQHWGKEWINSMVHADKNQQEIIKNLPHITPPDNMSHRTVEELQDLQKDQLSRNLKDVDEIICEQDLNCVIERFTSDPMIKGKLLDLMDYITPIVVSIKNRYNRVRPSYLDANIKPVISVPLHPSYPSGHAIQAYVIAYVMTDIFPEKEQRLMHIADSIAINREIAGVHYRSDSEYGKLIARHLFDNYFTGYLSK